MKRTAVLIILLIIAVVSCDTDQSISFDQISAPYLEAYGEPEEVRSVTYSNRVQVYWWYWDQGFMVNFGWDLSLSYAEDWIVVREVDFELRSESCQLE